MRNVLSWVAVLMLALVSTGRADGPKLGFAISVEGDGFILNPLVTKITVASVEKASLAEGAGVVAGDEIIQIEGQPVIGRRAKELQKYLVFGAGETRTLRVKHVNGEQVDARLTKPK